MNKNDNEYHIQKTQIGVGETILWSEINSKAQIILEILCYILPLLLYTAIIIFKYLAKGSAKTHSITNIEMVLQLLFFCSVLFQSLVVMLNLFQNRISKTNDSNKTQIQSSDNINVLLLFKKSGVKVSLLFIFTILIFIYFINEYCTSNLLETLNDFSQLFTVFSMFCSFYLIKAQHLRLLKLGKKRKTKKRK